MKKRKTMIDIHIDSISGKIEATGKKGGSGENIRIESQQDL
jgi:hypothetical protein